MLNYFKGTLFADKCVSFLPICIVKYISIVKVSFEAAIWRRTEVFKPKTNLKLNQDQNPYPNHKITEIEFLNITFNGNQNVDYIKVLTFVSDTLLNIYIKYQF